MIAPLIARPCTTQWYVYDPSAIGIVTVFTPDVNLGVDAIAGLSNVALCHSLSMLRNDTTAPGGTVTVDGLKLFACSVIVGPVGAPMLPGANGFEKRGEVRKVESVSEPR